MEFSKTRAVGAAVLAVALAIGGSVSPASAREGDLTVVSVSGHVSDIDGKPIKGIVVESSCFCDADFGDKTAHGRDATSSTGFYEFRVQKRYALSISFSDPKDRYFGVWKAGDGAKANASGYVIDVEMKRVSKVSGVIEGVNGAHAELTPVKFYDAETGKARGHGIVDSRAHYVARLKPGSYKVLFGEGSLYINKQWYGGFATPEQSPTITVGYGGSVTGIDASVTPKLTISGTITIDGEAALDSVRERVVLTLRDQKGSLVGKTVRSGVFSFVRLGGGTTFTIEARPLNGDFVRPFSQTVHVEPGTAIDDLALDLTSNPASSTSTRTTAVEFKPSQKASAETGKVLWGKIVVSSYGDVANAKLVIYIAGRRVDSLVVPASGRINWKVRLGKVVPGKFAIRAKYYGTETTRPRSALIYELSGV